MKKFFVILGLIVGSFMLISGTCESTPQKSISGAEAVTSMFQIPKNSQGNTTEQQNIMDRQKVTTDPTKVLWIHLIALDGNIIKRMPVRCKVTSSGKRLEPVSCTGLSSTGNYYPAVGGTNFTTSELLQPDGTFGSSDNYIFWFDTYGRYHQYGTAGGIGYLITDYPIDLRNPMNEITGLYNVQEAAMKWQKEQEAELRKKEGR